MSKYQCHILLVSLIYLSQNVAVAATSTTTFNVTATVAAACSVSANDLAFGAFVPTGPNVDATTTFSVTCTNNTPYDIGLNEGLAPGATVTTRQMLDGGNTLNYGLFQDAAYLTNWGDTVGVDTVALIGNGAAQVTTLYGRIPGAQATVPAGSYSDTITVTVTY